MIKKGVKINRFLFGIKVWAVCSIPFVIASFLLDPDKVIAGGYTFIPDCIFKSVTENECIGCGFTRSMTLFAHGRLEESVSYNKMGFVIFMLIIIINAILVCSLFKKRKKVTIIDDDE